MISSARVTSGEDGGGGGGGVLFAGAASVEEESNSSIGDTISAFLEAGISLSTCLWLGNRRRNFCDGTCAAVVAWLVAHTAFSRHN